LGRGHRVTDSKAKDKRPMEHHNIGDFLRGQSSRIITSLSDSDKTAFILKHGKPIAVVMSNERYERLLEAGIDINEY
jgi:PHD/YefM family antitoxin component YafN of YafNO toxin-antitoxin module